MGKLIVPQKIDIIISYDYITIREVYLMEQLKEISDNNNCYEIHASSYDDLNNSSYIFRHNYGELKHKINNLMEFNDKTHIFTVKFYLDKSSYGCHITKECINLFKIIDALEKNLLTCKSEQLSCKIIYRIISDCARAFDFYPENDYHQKLFTCRKIYDYAFKIINEEHGLSLIEKLFPISIEISNKFNEIESTGITVHAKRKNIEKYGNY